MPATASGSDNSTTRYDVIVIGAGVIGCAIALHLARKGKRTLNVDALPAAGYGSTSSSAAVIRTYYSTLDGTALAYEGYHEWKNWRETLGADSGDGLARFIETGTMVMKTVADNYQAQVLKHAEALGIPHEHWTAEDIERHLPGYNLDCFAPPRTMDDDAFGTPTGGAIQGAVFFPQGGYVDDPQIAARNLKDAAARAGAAFRFNTRVVRIPVEDGSVAGVVCENGDRLSADIIINVGGPHSGRVNALLDGDPGVRIGHRPLRQEVVQIRPPETFGYSREGLIVSDNDIGCYIKPGSGGQLMIGSQNPACDPHIENDPDDFSRDLTDRALTYAYRYSQRLPDLGVSQHPVGVADLYDATDDWLPIYDRSDVDGYYLAIGTSGNQFKNALVAGRLMSDLIDYCEAGNDHDNTPLQFPLRHVDHTLNTGAFSRKRELTKESSFSVLG
ncbi:NAD(P)/FAD-dependent oxidoreductase [Roseibium aggregatum]|uniref:FAD-binding oxidoreductase n=1 Tax=Roseibium aggregatum TaxID=187304 RepID=A0A939EEH7_9HYPH|nr:FAD-dependent oxidoreductase [Roseibium aggregatum]MBN9671762.1 FAD-binding oxidoreductase [Roseibium aggregatum]